jgi:hypothetical protein
MRVLTFLLALVPCAALAAQEAPAPAGEVSPVATSTSPATATPAEPPAPVEELPLPPPPPPAAAPYPRWGFFLGFGVPQATTLSVLFRPVPLVRLHAGPSWDYLGFGYHGGVTLTPIRWAISPTLGVEAGRFSSFDVTRVVKDPDPSVASLMKDVSVTYAAALLGLEFGSQRGFCFDLKLGYTWITVDSRGTGTFTGSGGTIGVGGTTNDATIKVVNPTLRVTAPTVQLGVQYFF